MPCGEDKCYDPKTQTCCADEGRACDKDSEYYKCCDNECCADIGYCASDGYCELCPASTRTVTTTWSSTTTSAVTRTVSRAPENEDTLEFSCAPVTATNVDGAVLELGDDCALSYQPPSISEQRDSTSTSEATTEKRVAPRRLAPEPRQAGCTPYTTYTDTTTKTVLVTRTTTTSTTVTVTPLDEGFSCPEMSATNAAGDELSLNQNCELEFSPAEPTETEAGGSDNGGANEGPNPQGDAGDAGPLSVQITMGSLAYILAMGGLGLLIHNC